MANRCLRAKRAASFNWCSLGATFVGCTVLLGSAPGMAQDDEKLNLAVGGYSVFNYDSAMSLTETNVGVGVSITPSDALGLDGEQTVLRLDGRYRFNTKHAFTFSWYRISVDSSKILLDDIDWVDEEGNTVVIPTGTAVSASLGYDIFKVGYL